jgi:hypothetical protein
MSRRNKTSSSVSSPPPGDGSGDSSYDASTTSSSTQTQDRSDVRESVDAVARSAANEAKQKAESLYEGATTLTAEASAAIDRAADGFASSGQETLSQATAALSDRVRTLSKYLEDRRLEDLIGDARQLARSNPTLFVAGGVALGFALSRFLKASAAQESTASRGLS